MKTIPFVKMHGIGNDYIYINAIVHPVANPSKLAKVISDRHFGIGSDGLILIMKSTVADFRMRMFNSDGSEAEMCGNGIRCFAKYVYDNGLSSAKKITVETKAGIKELLLSVKGKKVAAVTVNMGMPVLERSLIPMRGALGSVVEETIELADSVKFELTAVSMGNPHAVIFVEDTENFPVAKYGPMIETHPLFPKRTNVEFVKVVNKKKIIQRTWERGAGETLACGTGASASVVAGIITGRLAREVKVKLLGGELVIKWDEKSGFVYMTGPAVEVFRGEFPL